MLSINSSYFTTHQERMLPLRACKGDQFLVAFDLEVAKINSLFMYKEDTIAAIATPSGQGGVAIIRVSGPEAESIAKAIFSGDHNKNGALRSHMLYHGRVLDPGNKNVLDEVLLTIMRKPRSYTGEDVVEIHCHGGVFLVRQILALILSQGARHAEPGEFTKRAFLNGRLDLTQAEGVLDLIRARTDKAIDLAFSQVDGALSKSVGEIREKLLDILVQVEAAIDFPDEELELLERQQLAVKINALRTKIGVISDTYEWGRLFREGARVCICGRPNVGKSSLLNALLGEQRVIVTPVPGTTRDVIEESINLAGLPVVLWDTAGLRETEDQIEKIGVDLTRRHLEKADAVVAVVDGSVGLTDEDCTILKSIGGRKSLIAINKNDLPPVLDRVSVEKVVSGMNMLSVSAKTSDGIEIFKESLRRLILGSQAEPPIVVANLRHRNALVRSSDALNHAEKAIMENLSPELFAVDLNEARESLEEVIGLVTKDDILERIFSNFCIGK